MQGGQNTRVLAARIKEIEHECDVITHACVERIPVSTTHTITGAIVGVGSVVSASAVRWGVAGRIVWAWLLTIPCSAFIAALTWTVFH